MNKVVRFKVVVKCPIACREGDESWYPVNEDQIGTEIEAHCPDCMTKMKYFVDPKDVLVDIVATIEYLRFEELKFQL